MLIDPNTPAGGRALARLDDEIIIWLTTVTPKGQPQASPVWFWWDGEEFLVYSLPSARVRNIEHNPKVALNLDGNGEGGDIVTLEGIARIDPAAPPAYEHAEYVAKYQRKFEEHDWTPEWFASRYSVPIRIQPTRARYH
jgi:PPOX class probable F420-dependent enzyme